MHRVRTWIGSGGEAEEAAKGPFADGPTEDAVTAAAAAAAGGGGRERELSLERTDGRYFFPPLSGISSRSRPFEAVGWLQEERAWEQGSERPRLKEEEGGKSINSTYIHWDKSGVGKKRILSFF
jgi:hypothetical protein